MWSCDGVDVGAEEGEVYHNVKELGQDIDTVRILARIAMRRTLSKMSSVQEPSAMVYTVVNYGRDEDGGGKGIRGALT